MDQEKVIVIDFGGQYNQLVARRVRECNVYCEIYSYRTDIEQIKAMNPKGIILTGGPNSCYEADSPTYTKELFELGIPVLGLCYGAQLMNHILGGKVEKAPVREYGKTEVFVDKSSPLFEGVATDSAEGSTICWMSHFDYISKPAPGFQVVAHTADCPVAADENPEKKLYAIQFHPEVLHTVEGSKMLHNFVRNICGCAGTGAWILSWSIQSKRSVKKSVMERFSLHYPEVWILLLQQDFFPVQSENSLPAYSSITVCSERTKETRSRKFSDRTDSLT